MKTCIAVLFFAFAASAQNLQPIVANVPISFGKTNVFNSSFYTLTTTPASKQTVFISYNKMTGYCEKLNDSGATITSIAYLDNLYRGVRIDSFNPNGATNLKEGVFSGALNLIFNGNTGRSFFIR